MPNEEFNDLQNFGRTIKRRKKNKTKEKHKNIFIIKIKSFDKEKIKYFFKKIYKRLIFTRIRLKKYRQKLSFLVDDLIRNISKTKISLPSFSKQKNYVKCYKLVEKRTRRRNKIIIVRKSVPYKLKREYIGPSKTNLENLVNLTFDSGIYYRGL